MNRFNKAYYNKQFAGYALNQERKQIFSWHLRQLFLLQPNLKTVLDVGCGFGYFLSLCDKAGLTTYGLEVSDFAIKKAKKFTRAKIGKIYDSSFLPEKLDATCAFDVLEHTKDDKKIICFIYKKLRPGGVFYGTTPNRNFFLHRFLEKNDPTHVNIHDLSYWLRLLEKAGFKNISAKYLFSFGLPPTPSLREKLGCIIKPIFTRWENLGQAIIFWATK